MQSMTGWDTAVFFDGVAFGGIVGLAVVVVLWWFSRRGE